MKKFWVYLTVNGITHVRFVDERHLDETLTAFANTFATEPYTVERKAA
jgi:hypothetical protein